MVAKYDADGATTAPRPPFCFQALGFSWGLAVKGFGGLGFTGFGV